MTFSAPTGTSALAPGAISAVLASLLEGVEVTQPTMAHEHKHISPVSATQRWNHDFSTMALTLARFRDGAPLAQDTAPRVGHRA
jgi:hypothetical protein